MVHMIIAVALVVITVIGAMEFIKESHEMEA